MDSRLQEILALEEGWDGDRAAPIKPEVVDQVDKFLDKSSFEAVPTIVPSPDGCILLAWNCPNNVYLEIEFDGTEISHMLRTPDGKFLHW